MLSGGDWPVLSSRESATAAAGRESAAAGRESAAAGRVTSRWPVSFAFDDVEVWQPSGDLLK